MARTVPVTLTANVTPFTASMQQAGRSVKALDAELDGAAKGADKLVDASKKQEAAAKKAAASAKQAAAEQKAALQDVSTGLLAVGAATTAVGVMAVKSFSDFSAEMSAVKATGDDAAQNIDALRQAAMDAGREFGQFTGTEAADGIEQLAKAGLQATEVLDGGLTGALALAAAGEMAVGDAAEVTAKTLAQFQLKGKDASHVADLLAAGAGKAVGDVSDLGMALAQGGTVANQFGISVEETVGTLSLFAQNALLGSDAGTSLKQMLLQLASPTKQSQRALDDLGISAYDANGEFVGMAGLADQLQDSMRGLSQEQQNAALKTIFGADAIRSASILMREGGDAVRQWTSDVNDQGFAMEVAATKMDNLKGDLQGLGGAWENLMITLGEGADGPLRELVQGITGLLDAAGENQQAVQIIGGIVLALGGIALTVGGIMKAVMAFRDFKAALETLGVVSDLTTRMDFLTASFGRNEIATKNLKRSLVDAGLALGAFAAAAAITSIIPDTEIAQVDEFSRVLGGLSKNAEGAKAELDEIAARGVQNWGYERKVEDMRGLFDVLGNTNGLVKGIDRIGLSMEKYLGLTAAGNSQWGTATKQIGNLDDALSRMDLKKDSAAFKQVADSAKAAGLSADQLAEAMPKTMEAMRAANAEAGKFGLTNEQLVDRMGGKIPSSINQFTKASDMFRQKLGTNTVEAEKNASAADKMAAPWDRAAKAMEAATEAAYENIDALRKQAEGALGLSNSQIATERAFINANKSIIEANKTLKSAKKGSEEYRLAVLAKKEAINGLVGQWMSERSAMEQNGDKAEDVAKRQEAVRKKINEVAKAAGYNATEIAKMNEEYGLTPDTVTVKVEAPGAEQAKKAADEFNQRLSTLPPSTQSTIIAIWNSQGFDAAMKAFNEADGKTATTYVRTIWTETSKSLPSMPGLPNPSTAPKRAKGGPIVGPGTKTSDDVLMWGSTGEFMQRAAAVDKYGMRFMEDLNALRIRKSDLPGFANGGAIQRPTLASPVAHPSSSSTYVTLPAPRQINQQFDITQREDPRLIANQIGRETARALAVS